MTKPQQIRWTANLERAREKFDAAMDELRTCGEITDAAEGGGDLGTAGQTAAGMAGHAWNLAAAAMTMIACASDEMKGEAPT